MVILISSSNPDNEVLSEFVSIDDIPFPKFDFNAAAEGKMRLIQEMDRLGFSDLFSPELNKQPDLTYEKKIDKFFENSKELLKSIETVIPNATANITSITNKTVTTTTNAPRTLAPWMNNNVGYWWSQDYPLSYEEFDLGGREPQSPNLVTTVSPSTFCQPSEPDTFWTTVNYFNGFEQLLICVFAGFILGWMFAMICSKRRSSRRRIAAQQNEINGNQQNRNQNQNIEPMEPLELFEPRSTLLPEVERQTQGQHSRSHEDSQPRYVDHSVERILSQYGNQNQNASGSRVSRSSNEGSVLISIDEDEDQYQQQPLNYWDGNIIKSEESKVEGPSLIFPTVHCVGCGQL